MATTKGHSQVVGTPASYAEGFLFFARLLQANVGTVLQK
jgi:hypothetical protein